MSHDEFPGYGVKYNLPSIGKMFELYSQDKRMFDFNHYGGVEDGIYCLTFSVDGKCSLHYQAHRLRYIDHMITIFGSKVEIESIRVDKNVRFVFPSPVRMELATGVSIGEAEDAIMLWLLTLN